MQFIFHFHFKGKVFAIYISSKIQLYYSITSETLFDLSNLLQDRLPELENLRARLGDAKGALDKEHLKSADLENKCQQLEEELKFKMSILEKELIEVT